MEFDNLELSVIDDGFNSDIDFDISLFDEIINIINFAFLKIGISSNDKSIFYVKLFFIFCKLAVQSQENWLNIFF